MLEQRTPRQATSPSCEANHPKRGVGGKIPKQGNREASIMPAMDDLSKIPAQKRNGWGLRTLRDQGVNISGQKKPLAIPHNGQDQKKVNIANSKATLRTLGEAESKKVLQEETK